VTVSVVIPFQSKDEHRLVNLGMILDYYRSEFPDWQIVIAPNRPDANLDHPAQVLADARNHGAKLATGDVLVFNDADSLVPAANVHRAVGMAEYAPGLVFAWREYLRLDRGLLRSYRDALGAPAGWSMMDSLACGCSAISRDCFDKVGGFDRSWLGGFEDYDFAQRCSQLWPLRRIDGPLKHLWHPRPATEPETSPDAERYFDLYIKETT
jgi:hypothetical protein